jgi:hypothetical protein
MPAPRTLPDPAVLAVLATEAAERHGVVLVRDALAAGLTDAQIRTLVRRGDWVSLGHGAVGVAPPPDDIDHLRRCAARLLAISGDAVISHASAGLLHGLPYVDAPSLPTLTVPRLRHVEHLLGLYSSRVPAHHRALLEDLPITTPARTVVDLLRTSTDRFEAQALADGALRTGVAPASVARVLAECSGWPGINQARRAWDLADGLAESPLESRSRLWMREGGLPEPQAQARIADRSGLVIARVDFLFRAQRTVVEADGRVKYDDPAPTRSPGSVLWEEKLREDRLRDLGFEVVRATWADGRNGGAALVERVLRAFARSARRAA